MQDQWNYSSSFLPYTGEPIEFRLEEREQPLHGIFADGVFHSRWANYGTDSVGSWRRLAGDSSPCPAATSEFADSSFSGIVKRMKRIVSRSQATT